SKRSGAAWRRRVAGSSPRGEGRKFLRRQVAPKQGDGVGMESEHREESEAPSEHKSDAEEPRPDVSSEPGLGREAAEPPENASAPGKARFGSMELDQGIVRALADMGFVEPMEVQEAVYAPAAAGRDLMVQSKTGSGKTAAFGIPIIERMHPEAKFVQ